MRGNKKIVSASDFRHPPIEETPEKINKNKKYKIYGEDGKTFLSAAILFVSGKVYVEFLLQVI